MKAAVIGIAGLVTVWGATTDRGVAVPANAATQAVHTVELSATAPAVLDVAGRRHLVHEVHITNLRREALELLALTMVAEDDAVLATLSGATLSQALLQPGHPRDLAVPPTLAPGRRAVVYLWLPLPGRSPTRVSHRLELSAPGATPALRTTVHGAGVTVSERSALVIDPPLAGGPWVAIYDPLLMGGHRTTLIAVDGAARIPARFAIDWIRAPEPVAGGPAPPNGEPLRNGFGSDVLAVADARVVLTRDGVPDLAAGVLRTPQPLPLDQGSGNYLILDLGDRHFAVYEHLKQGSVRVREGERVRRGQPVAQLGSSGSTSIGPHLHFHIADAGSTLGADGVPFVLRRFERLGAYASHDALVRGDAWLAQPPSVHQLQHPPPVGVLRF